jgi:hypothetical protein
LYRSSVVKKNLEKREDLLAHERALRHEEEAHRIHEENIEKREYYA